MGGDPHASDGTITHLLARAREGDRESADRVVALLYDELRSQARKELGAVHRPDGLNGTSLVHAACTRLLAREQIQANDRAHFKALFARAMHDEFVEFVRRKDAAKRGGDRRRIPLIDFEAEGERFSLDLLDVKESLETLARVDPDAAQILLLMFFGGSTLREAAAAMGCTFSAARGHWNYGRAWFLARLTEQEPRTSTGA